MATRTQSHQLSSGLYVSGRPETHAKERAPTIALCAAPYTGGDVNNSGELAKMFDISHSHAPPPPSRLNSSSQPKSGSGRLSNSGSMNRKSSGPVPLQPTGLITSGPLGRGSGQLGGSSQAVGGGSGSKPAYGSAVTRLGSEEVQYAVTVSKGAMWVFGVLVLMGLIGGAFLMVALKKAVILVAVVAVLMVVFVGVGWNYIATCGSIALESSFQRVPRCVYASTELYEYRGCGVQPANSKHRYFSWGCRHSEKYVADFYVSDFHTGLRALVKTGYGAQVAPLVDAATVVDVTKENRDLSPNFLHWLADRSLSGDDRILRLKEGYVKEGSTVSVMGIVRRHDNILMIVPPCDPVATGCQWFRFLLPMYVKGLILHCNDSQNFEVIPV
ncbi:hypothetical protein Cgig2_005328 [Carnegiea gigantea]|uniref:Ubiquitin-specific protease family C19-related protein n=1 Tax=Carnegiea gigantea TaxID=171969 RepID=A0A9Q1QCZ4_9CARY|nr:hypothetical protein Cgig2_005328 [Carnegiea gigantea]